MFWGEIDIGLDIITVFRVLFIFNNFIFINNANMKNCGSFKSFSYIYIYIYRYIDYKSCFAVVSFVVLAVTVILL